MTSTINLYRNDILFRQEDNFLIEDIANYLSSKSKESFSIQYQKISLNMEIKLIFNQDEGMDVPLTRDRYVYASIEQGKTYYFFIREIKWISSNACKLSLVMDTLNTFKLGEDYCFGDRTHILREHRDRFESYESTINYTYKVSLPIEANTTSYSSTIKIRDKKMMNSIDMKYGDIKTSFDVTTISVSFERVAGMQWLFKPNVTYLPSSNDRTLDLEITMTLTILIRKIDAYNENITPELYKTAEEYLGPFNGIDWYLVYRNSTSSENSAVNCYLVPSDNIKIHTDATSLITPGNLEQGYFYYIKDDIGFDFLHVAPNGKMWLYEGSVNGNSHYDYDISQIESYTPASTVTGYRRYITLPDTVKDLHDTTLYTDISITLTDIYLNSINDIDRTDPQIIKIISLPYSPVNLTYENNMFVFNPNEWNYDTSFGALKLMNTNIKFTALLSKVSNNFLDYTAYLDYFPIALSDITRELVDRIKEESKLYNSNFYYRKFVYDSFSYAVIGENIIYSDYSYDNYIRFTMTRTINSRFMFSFGFKLKVETQDYDNLLIISRNNEETLYNSAYLNYIRTGYNYDVKVKNQKIAYDSMSTIISALGAVATATLGNNPLTAAAAVGMGINAFKSAFSLGYNAISSDQSIQQKLKQYQNQSTSVSGADDIDLLNQYAGNCLKLVTYEMRDEFKQRIADIFWYTGYASDSYGVPDYKSRCRFNYLQCEPYIDYYEYKNLIDEEYNTALMSCWRAGVTIIHKYANDWDLSLTKHNYETSLLKYIE